MDLQKAAGPIRDPLESIMKKCDVCGTRILFGPVRSGDRAYCSYECRDQGDFSDQTSMVSDDQALELARFINVGDCPKCGGPGPIDVMYSYTVWSAIVITSCENHPEVSCAACGRKARLGAIVTCLSLGWWGLPLGPIMTVIQVFKNILGFSSSPVAGQPSQDLLPFAKMMLADQDSQKFIADRAESRSFSPSDPNPDDPGPRSDKQCSPHPHRVSCPECGVSILIHVQEDVTCPSCRTEFGWK